MDELNYDHDNPAVAHVLQFFRFEHLPDHLKGVSKSFTLLAMKVAWEHGQVNRETTIALRKLLEAKDAAVRAALLAQKEDQD